MYATVAAAAALHQVLLRSLGDDKVVVQNVASGLFCVLFVALGVVDRPSLLAASMLGYLISDSTCVTTAGYAMHHSVTAMLLLVSLRGNGAYDDLTGLRLRTKFHGDTASAADLRANGRACSTAFCLRVGTGGTW